MHDVRTTSYDVALAPGTEVEVRSRFDGGWKRGFEVDMVVDDGFLVRRHSDNSVLPVAFSAAELRPAATAGAWG